MSGGPDGGLEFTGGAAGARGEFASPSWSPDGARMVFHRDVESELAAAPRRMTGLDPRFRLVRTGVFAVVFARRRPAGAQRWQAGILHNRVLVMDADGTHRAVLFERLGEERARTGVVPAG